MPRSSLACVDEKPKGKPQANPSGELCVLLDQTTVARLEEIAKLYAGDMSKTVLRLAELVDPEGVSMLQELMSDVEELNDPWWWKQMVKSAEGRERDFRAFIEHCLSETPRLYDDFGLDRASELHAVIDQALVTPGRDHWEQRRRKSEHIRKGLIRPKRRSFK
jgi:hypothetical protein